MPGVQSKGLRLLSFGISGFAIGTQHWLSLIQMVAALVPCLRSKSWSHSSTAFNSIHIPTIQIKLSSPANASIWLVEVIREGRWLSSPCNLLTYWISILAIMFGKLRMSVNEAYEEFDKIRREVYATKLSAKERTDRLRECIEDLLARRGHGIDMKFRGTEGCPWYVLTSLQVHNPIYMPS